MGYLKRLVSVCEELQVTLSMHEASTYMLAPEPTGMLKKSRAHADECCREPQCFTLVQTETRKVVHLLVARYGPSSHSPLRVFFPRSSKSMLLIFLGLPGANPSWATHVCPK